MASLSAPFQHATLSSPLPSSDSTNHASSSALADGSNSNRSSTGSTGSTGTASTTRTAATALTRPDTPTATAMEDLSDNVPLAKTDGRHGNGAPPPTHGHGRSSLSQENVAPPHSPVAAKLPPAALAVLTATPNNTVTAAASAAKAARPGSRIMSGSELSPLKILQGRVAGGGGGGGPPSSAATTATTISSPASPEDGLLGGGGSATGGGDDQASSSTTTSSPPPPPPPHTHITGQRKLSLSATQMLPPALPLGRTPRKSTAPRFPVKISVPPTAVSAAASTTTTTTTTPGTPATPASPATSSADGTRSPRLMLHHQQQQQPPAPHSPPQQSQALFAQIRKQPPLHGRQLSLDEAIQLNEGLKQAIEIFEDEASVIDNEDDDGSRTQRQQRQQQAANNGKVAAFLAQNRGRDRDLDLDLDLDQEGPDDTIASTFSTFSALPNATMLSRLGRASPSKMPAEGGTGPPLNRAARPSGNTTNLLLDFTEQLRHAQSQQQQQQQQHGRLSTSAAAAASAATPQRKGLVNLLDFEIPPLPTPRSIPSVTPRELESLKSTFLSEISSLKASLSGKAAEVLALKTAVGDAETRVGACQEQLREERTAREQLAEDKAQWERRAREMEEVLRKVKGEIVLSQRDREELEAKLDEAEKRREMAEMMAQEAESKMAAMRAGRATLEGGGAAAAAATPGTSTVQREVEIAVERVARELHAAYKAKHEAKVTALKKSYEARWEKRVRELETAAEALAEENDKLRDAVGAGRMGADNEEAERRRTAEAEAQRQRETAARDAAQRKELGAEVEKLEAVVRTVQADNAELRTLLEQERVEKGELVLLAEEMMAMQQTSFLGGATTGGSTPSKRGGGEPLAAPAASRPAAESPRKPKTPAPSRVSMPASGLPGSSHVGASGRRNSILLNGGASSTGASAGVSTATTPGRARPMSVHGGAGSRLSGLKPPSSSTMATGGVPSRIGRLGHERKQGSISNGSSSSSNGGGIPRSSSSLGSRSGLMSSIEKMGSHRGGRE